MRLFIAIDLPDPIRQSLMDLLAAIPVGRPTPPEQLHLTLHFLGEISPENYSELSQALAQIQSPSFTLQLKGLGCFPNPTRPRILWAGLKPCSALLDLKTQLDQVLSELGYSLETKPFHPHLTLARIKHAKPNALKEFLQKNFAFQFQAFPIKEFHLYSSKLMPQGAIHQKEQTIPLKESL